MTGRLRHRSNDRPRRLLRASPVVLSLAACLACAPAPPDPVQVVERYFAWVGRDPVRVLPLLSDAYHRSHGLTVAKLENFSWGHRTYIDPERATGANPDLAAVDAERGIDGARFAWLMIQIAPNFQQLARQLEYQVVGSRVDGDRATVDVRIGRAIGFRQRFELSRDPDVGRWRIDGATQEGVVRSTSYLAFIAMPAEPMMRYVSNALGLDQGNRSYLRSRSRRRAIERARERARAGAGD